MKLSIEKFINTLLILGDANQLTFDGGQTAVLTVPSGSESGLKLKVGADIQAGITYKLVIDFDAARSVVKSGNSGMYNLVPVIRAQMEATTGAIQGSVSPNTVSSVVYPIIGEDSVSTYPDDNGQFLIRALEAGTYSVSAVPDQASELSTATVGNIEVVIGETAQVGTLELTN